MTMLKGEMTMWIELNNNPLSRRVGDCAVRAVAVALGVDWETAYIMLSANGYAMGDVPSADAVWGATFFEIRYYDTFYFKVGVVAQAVLVYFV